MREYYGGRDLFVLCSNFIVQYLINYLMLGWRNATVADELKIRENERMEGLLIT